eukprot:scaffold166184_cov37-Tisochrysis_lutea.AAC.2
MGVRNRGVVNERMQHSLHHGMRTWARNHASPDREEQQPCGEHTQKQAVNRPRAEHRRQPLVLCSTVGLEV